MTDAAKWLGEAMARIDASVADVNRRLAQIEIEARATAKAKAAEIRAIAAIRTIAELPVNTMLVQPIAMRLRPIRVPDTLYRVDWSNVYKVGRAVRYWPMSYVLFTELEIDTPDTDCVVSMLREDCIGMLSQTHVPESLYPFRLWLWREQVWEAVRHDAWPSPLELWYWWRCWFTGETCI